MALNRPDISKLKQQADDLDRLIKEASRLRAALEAQMKILHHSGDQDRSGQPDRRRLRRK